jgi:FkbM family methyltransferase
MAGLMKRGVRRFLALWGYALVSKPKALLANRSSQLNASFDMVLSHFLLSRKDPPYFVQVGAFNGVDGDPLHSYVQKGLLKGCMIEPQTDYFEQLKSNYAAVEGLVFKRAAIGATSGEATLYRVRPGTPGPPWLYQIASFRRDVLMKHAPGIPGLEDAIITESVPVTTFDALFAELNARPDIVVVDTEGYDYEIIKQLFQTGCRPGLVLYEHKHLNEPDKDACLRLVIGAGYSVAFGVDDTIALRTEDQTAPA